jgi:hypothetical protein
VARIEPDAATAPDPDTQTGLPLSNGPFRRGPGRRNPDRARAFHTTDADLDDLSAYVLTGWLDVPHPVTGTQVLA